MNLLARIWHSINHQPNPPPGEVLESAQIAQSAERIELLIDEAENAEIEARELRTVARAVVIEKARDLQVMVDGLLKALRS